MKYLLLLLLPLLFAVCTPPADPVVVKPTCVGVTAEFKYDSDTLTSLNHNACNWLGTNDASLVLPNPKPVFEAAGKPGVFSASPAGIVFVNILTGEIDLTASQPGSYLITNTLGDTCNLNATAPFTFLPPKTFTIEELVADFGFVVDSYYRIKDVNTHPELMNDSTLYEIRWYHVKSTGVIRTAADFGAQWETVGRNDFRFFITPDPATGKTRDTDALVVDINNLQTGCTTRVTFGKPLSELPEPGHSL